MKTKVLDTVLCIAVIGFLMVLNSAHADTQPNVLFIAVDDLNDWIGCLGGNPDTKTPNMDRLAARGMLFANTCCAAPACIPSRSALMTGVKPADSGLYSNMNGEFRQFLDLKKAETIPQYFARYGYYTIGAGKVLHSPSKEDYDELAPFSYWKNPLPAGITKENLRRNVAEYIEDWLPLDVDKTEMTDWKTAQWAAERLGRKHDKPFFLACGFYRPHVPLHAPQEYYDRFPLDKLTLPKIKTDDLEDLDPSRQRKNKVVQGIVENETTWRKGVQAYLANINFADECVGLLLDALDASPYKNNTIVMLWSDHGLHQGEKYQFAKFTLWEEASRCVLMCAGPGIPTGTRCDQPVNLLDMYPTLLEMCDLPPKAEQAGISFLPQIKDRTKERDPSITANEQGFSVRSQNWRYIWYYNGTDELYDHTHDPMEWDNLASVETFREIKEWHKAFVPKNPVPGRNPKKKPKPNKKK
jgi:arylsulfatase A-like enzyme